MAFSLFKLKTEPEQSSRLRVANLTHHLLNAARRKIRHGFIVAVVGLLASSADVPTCRYAPDTVLEFLARAQGGR